MKFQKAGIYLNPSKNSGFGIAHELQTILRDNQISVKTNTTVANALGKPDLAEGDFRECDILFVLGGDGTILSALDYSVPKSIPILGVNLGRMGFLTEVEPADLYNDVTAVLNGDYSLDSRMTMTIKGQDERSCFALNEVVITRATRSVRILSLEIIVNGTLVDRISGDGLIVASTTGSTAYSLSAGGPIIQPGLDCFVITPICPHTMNARPVVVSSNDEVCIRVLDGSADAHAVLDGRKFVDVRSETEGVTILRSRLEAKFIRLHDRNYFSLLRNKLSEWTH